MNAFKRKALATAVFAGLGIGSAHAVYQDANGLGQGLYYPYYTVQQSDGNAYHTYISVVNTTTTGKVVKVRFREGKNSREVLDFNLYLSPNDVWTGAVIPADATTSSPGRLISADKSCTNPAIPAGGVDFRNFQYSGANDDGAGTGLERTREGYIEMLEMATVIGTSLTNITHVAGVPRNCAAVQGAVNALPVADRALPSGGLSGTGTLINVNNGSDAGYNAIALANVRAAINYTDVGNEQGTFAQADPISVVVTSSSSGTRAYTSPWAAGIDAVSATMTHQSVINEYVLDASTKSNTDWVMTFPTKRFYVTAGAAGTAVPPFTNKFTSTGSCEPFQFDYWNREEDGRTPTGGDFSPSVISIPGLCWESTIMSFRSGQAHNPSGLISGVLGSVNTLGVTLNNGFQNGWGRITFTGANQAVPFGLKGIAAGASAVNVTTGVNANGQQQIYYGLPVIGFMVRTFNNGTLTCTGGSCQGNYGSAFRHNYLQNITPAP